MRLVKFRCLILGHDDRVRRVRGRMFLECSECSRETDGWDIASEINSSLHHTRSLAWAEPGRELYRNARSVVRLVHKRADAGVDQVARAGRELWRSASTRRAA